MDDCANLPIGGLYDRPKYEAVWLQATDDKKGAKTGAKLRSILQGPTCVNGDPIPGPSGGGDCGACDNWCENDGSCPNSSPWFGAHCTKESLCPLPFSDTRAQEPNCSAHRVCSTNVNGAGACVCKDGWTGVDCMDATTTITTTTTTTTTTKTTKTSTTNTTTNTITTSTNTATTTTTSGTTTTTTTILHLLHKCDPRNDHCDRANHLVCSPKKYQCEYVVTTTSRTTGTTTTQTTTSKTVTKTTTTTTTTPTTTATTATVTTVTATTVTTATIPTTTATTVRANTSSKATTAPPATPPVSTPTTAAAAATPAATMPSSTDPPNAGSRSGLPVYVYGAIGGGLLVLLVTTTMCYRARKRVAFGYNHLNNDDNGADTNDIHLLDFGTVVHHGAFLTTNSSTSAFNNCNATGQETKFDKFLVKAMRLGRATQAAAGLADLMGYNDMSLLHYIDGHGGGMEAIIHEINTDGTEEDKRNLRGLIDGTYVNPPNSNGDPLTPEELVGQSKTIDELMQTEQVKTAKLLRAHVLALRLYTTSTYATMNSPLRTDPPTQPNPLAATTYYASQGIKLLRSVAGNLPNAHEAQDLWRGMKDMTISDAFFESGGTEFACMSTSTSQEVAIDFAESTIPMILKLETKDFMSRGADISFLSVYPGEGETLFPPLTFLRPIARQAIKRKGKTYLMVRCEPVIP